MLALTVQITRYVDDHFPGFVECTFQDAEGKIHVFVEKVSVVSREALDVTSVYPAIGAMHCENELAWMDEAGRRLVRINTDHPWHIESMAGESRFVVLASQFADRLGDGHRASAGRRLRCRTQRPKGHPDTATRRLTS